MNPSEVVAFHLVTDVFNEEAFAEIAKIERLEHFQYDSGTRDGQSGKWNSIIMNGSPGRKKLMILSNELFGVRVPVAVKQIYFPIGELEDISRVNSAINRSYKKQSDEKTFKAVSISLGVRANCENVDGFIKEFLNNLIASCTMIPTVQKISLLSKGFEVEVKNLQTDQEIEVLMTVYDSSYIEAELIEQENQVIAVDFSPNFYKNDYYRNVRPTRGYEFRPLSLIRTIRKIHVEGKVCKRLFEAFQRWELESRNFVGFLGLVVISCWMDEFDIKDVPFGSFRSLRRPHYLYFQSNQENRPTTLKVIAIRGFKLDGNADKCNEALGSLAPRRPLNELCFSLC